MEIYVLDTSVLVADPNVLQINDAEIIIPSVAIREIDQHKKRPDEVGRNARYISRLLDSLREKGSLLKGVEHNGSIIRIGQCGDAIDGNDLKIIECAGANPGCTLLTKDINVRLAADAANVIAKDYNPTETDIDDIYKGWREIQLSSDRIDKFYQEGKLNTRYKLCPNEFVIIKDDCGYNKSAIARYDSISGNLLQLEHAKDVLFGDIEALNAEQKFAFELLLDANVELVSFIGKAGTGKTLLSLAAGLEQIIENRKFKKLIICRTIVPIGGKDLGAMPGDFDEKMAPWASGIFDGLALLAENHDYEVDDIIEQGKIEIIPLSYLRGRSLRESWIVIDEAQNITPKEIKTVISRAGEGSKVILTGDIQQIDHPFLDQTNNGLTHVVERFKGQKEFGHVFMTHTKRSRLAELASELL
jgi:PhoH-like ATPase